MARKKELEQFKGKVMKAKGYDVNMANPNDIKYEIAKEQGIPLNKGKNGQLTSEQAGKIGGPIGGTMVKEMIRMAQESLKQN